MMKHPKKPESLGCFGNAVMFLFGLLSLAVILGSAYFLAPITERAIQSSFCKPETIHDEHRGRRRTTTCIDKKTGQKIDVSLLQIIGCCPSVFILIFSAIFLAVLSKILHGAKMFKRCSAVTPLA